MTKTVKLPLSHRRISVLYLLVFASIISLSVMVYATTVNITTTNAAGYQGIYYQDNGYYGVSGALYAVVQGANSATSQPLAWSNGAIGYVNAQVAGHWELTFTLTINAGAPISTTYTITMYSTSSTGTTSSLYTFQFASPASVTAGQTMTIIWDTGSTTWTAPAALSVTIA